jgi:hypothetical protein
MSLDSHKIKIISYVFRFFLDNCFITKKKREKLKTSKYQYFTIYRQYFLLNLNNYLITHCLKSAGTKDHFRQVKVPGTTSY